MLVDPFFRSAKGSGELSDSPWEESEAESRFADDVTYLDTEDSSADGYWSDKAWSLRWAGVLLTS